MKWKTNVLYALSGAFMGLSCQPPSLVINAVVGVLSAFALAILVERHPLRMTSGVCFGFALTAVQFHWVSSVFKLFSGSSLIFSLSFAIFMYLLASLQFVLFAWLFVIFNKWRASFLALSLPLAWTIAELTFPRFIPWFQGSTLFALTPFVQIADVGGPALVSFLLFWCASLFARIITVSRNSSYPTSLMAYSLTLSLVFVFVMSYGLVRIHLLKRADARASSLNLVVVQPNLDPRSDFTFERLGARSQKLADLTDQALNNSQYPVDLIVWPESAVGFTYYLDENRLSREDRRWPLVKPIKSLNVPVLFGGQVQIGRDYTPETEFHNAAILLKPDGSFGEPYFKERLFPFSEQIPLASRFPGIKRLFRPFSNFREGSAEQTRGIEFGNTVIAVRICYEDIWPNLFRLNTIRDRAELLVSLSNDGWFAETAAMYQHNLLALWRAIENRRYLVRAGNNGLSVIVNPTGKILVSLEPHRGASTNLVGVRLLTEQTLFSRYGNLNNWIILLAIIICLKLIPTSLITTS